MSDVIAESAQALFHYLPAKNSAIASIGWLHHRQKAARSIVAKKVRLSYLIAAKLTTTPSCKT
ncbi:MAG: hypothetical protein HWQ38_10315 [Nostoc sp. NMS7]|uniref:hypothetical protein n=1 Tax=Nostoc sp. NMS7 TaxID=2815391 RepID=UPI0025D190ED|nr:hypothetical protein [Nostoc sp. NMS7]MBN3946856.1 hypothetical protein [Nostoc sp. NMS7]